MSDKPAKPKKVRKHRFHNIDYSIKWKKPDKKHFGFEARGSCSDPHDKHPTIEIDPNLEGEELMEVIIHECTHACLWPISEEFVEQGSKDIAKLLWKIGFRLKK